MKKIAVMFSACLLFSLTVHSQPIPADKVPAKIKQAFSMKFLTATDVRYELELKTYEVNFKENGVVKSATFDPSGNWLETETERKESDLPKEISASVAKNFPGFKISEASITETSDNRIFYEMVLKKNKEGYEVQLSPKGDILKKTLLNK
jgi:uncharacterized membrane protein YkoI